MSILKTFPCIFRHIFFFKFSKSLQKLHNMVEMSQISYFRSVTKMVNNHSAFQPVCCHVQGVKIIRVDCLKPWSSVLCVCLLWVVFVCWTYHSRL